MTRKPDETFWTRLATDKGHDVLADYLRLTGAELREALTFLIRHREQLRDENLAALDVEAERLHQSLERNDREKLLEELQCFRDVLALHQRLVEEDESER